VPSLPLVDVVSLPAPVLPVPAGVVLAVSDIEVVPVWDPDVVEPSPEPSSSEQPVIAATTPSAATCESCHLRES